MNLIIRLFKVFYWPICRAYARKLGNKPADILLQALCKPVYFSIYLSWPNFVQPRRFTEKVWRRQLFDRNLVLTMISDKLQVRDYVADKGYGGNLIPLLWYGDNPEEIPFNILPDKFVIKTNHGCGYNLIVNDKTKIDRRSAIQELDKWLAENFCRDKYLGIAWGYKDIKPTIIIESFIEENGKAPLDYKFFCFSGCMEFFKIDFNRFEDHSEQFFDRRLNKLNLVEVGLKQHKGEVTLPDNFDEMVRVSESLSTGFDFMRIDLYNINGKIYFSEMTPYPGGVSAKFQPDSYDFIFGQKWN